MLVTGILLKDNTHYTRLESTNGIFKIDVDAAQQIGSEVISFQISTDEKARITSDGYLAMTRHQISVQNCILVIQVMMVHYHN